MVNLYNMNIFDPCVTERGFEAAQQPVNRVSHSWGTISEGWPLITVPVAI